MVKVVDFGLARLYEPSRPEASLLKTGGTLVGTPFYMAPEQARDARAADVRSDLYSLGCSLFHALTGRVPYTGTNSMEILLQHALDEIPRVGAARPDVPRAPDDLI